MKKLTITSILALCMACPAMANIDKDASTATCDNTTIGTTTGPANLQAAWTANTINLDWYDGNTKLTVGTSSATCTYDSGITLPSIPTVPAGYTFGGWKVRMPAINIFADLDASIGGGNSVGHAKGIWIDDGTYSCTQNTDTLSGKKETCQSDLSVNEWKATFSYGTVYGKAKCSAKSGNNNNYYTANINDWSATTDDLDSISSGDRKYCWCQADGLNINGDTQTQESTIWVFNSDRSTEIGCFGRCSQYCSLGIVRSGSSGLYFRKALFGQEN